MESSFSYQEKRIFVVDDEVDITTVFKLGLEEADLQVDVYNEPLLALSDYKPGIYDLLLLDIRMPGMNGFELYRKIIDGINKKFISYFGLHSEWNEYKDRITLSSYSSSSFGSDNGYGFKSSICGNRLQE